MNFCFADQNGGEIDFTDDVGPHNSDGVHHTAFFAEFEK